MQSRIDSLLTPDERRVLAVYSDPKRAGLRRAVRLSVQYALGAGIFAVLGLREQEPLYILPVYGIFLVFLVARLVGAKKVAGIIPSVIAKYEARIAELEG